jgi:hypothetical protein
MFSPVPIRAADGGSLVTIDFHLQAGAVGVPAIELVSAVNPNVRGMIQTALDDLQGPLTLHPLASARTPDNPQLTSGIATGQTGIAKPAAAQAEVASNSGPGPETAPLEADAFLVSTDDHGRGLPDVAQVCAVAAEISQDDAAGRSIASGSGTTSLHPGSSMVTAGGTPTFQSHGWLPGADAWADGQIGVPVLIPPEFLPLGKSLVPAISTERDMADLVFLGADHVFANGFPERPASGLLDRTGSLLAAEADDETAAVLAVLDEYFAQTGGEESDLG